MPKIKTVSKFIDHGDTRTKVEYEVHYSTSNGFFAKLPKHFFANAELVSFEERVVKNIEFDYIRKYDPSRGIKTILVKADSEKQAEQKIEELLIEFLKSTTTRRPIIIVYFEGDNQTEYNRNFGSNRGYTEREFNKDHQKIIINFALKYTTEVSIAGSPPKYYDFINYNDPFVTGKITEQRTEVFIKGDHIIIDDTPENRSSLENTYTLFMKLIGKLKEFLTDKDKLLGLIASGQKLLQ